MAFIGSGLQALKLQHEVAPIYRKNTVQGGKILNFSQKIKLLFTEHRILPPKPLSVAFCLDFLSAKLISK